MTIYFVHAGTGTIIDAEDGVFILDTESLNSEDTAILESGDDTEITDLAVERGVPYRHNDLTWGNTISYSPSSIRTEIIETLTEQYPDDTEALEWGRNASDSELNAVASYILSGEYLWNEFLTNIMDGLREGLRWSREKGAK